MTEAVGYLDHYRHGPYREFAQEHRKGGTFGLNLIDVHQGEGEFSDPAFGTYSFILNMNDPVFEPEFNFGEGWFHHHNSTGCVNVQLPDVEARFRLPPLHLRGAIAPRMIVDELLASLDLPEGAIDVACGRFYKLPRVRTAMNAMWAAANRTDPSAALDIDAGFLTMMGDIVAACGHGLAPAPKLDDHRLARAVDYAETHIAAPLTVGELAGAACMSPSAFSRAFRAATDETPWAFVRRRRLERAGQQMARTDDTLMQVAADCGFTDASHLARCWKRAYGTTPREGGR
ncbi:AraC family transcriptional regulator [Jannaschia aquimarina]|uniref:CdhR_2 protein n=1 Tax=Jannaschia aquimarina TaxID=935700 RepID=A0A0D1EKY6_9RHOB|nr:AraC family transcriptional regulator [Jannaschia aquimarina]KIT18229.1 HTH-type transcriptional regulator CdhR [Jannaschia aquimarina]SNS82883.1 Helix-turn-helix domain-containing protein [Jannaschia aquimarina]